MNPPPPPPAPPRLFFVRIWAEPLGFRASVRDVESGRSEWFTSVPALLAFVEAAALPSARPTTLRRTP